VGGAYLWHAGYWGPHVGFYGGVNYGFGYGGVGFMGGEWRGGSFFYNREVVNVGVGIVGISVFSRPVPVVAVVSHVSFNGGAGGIVARPTAVELVAVRERHFDATALQVSHEHAAFGNPAFRASANGGHPAMGATARPGNFHPVAAAHAEEHAARAQEHAARAEEHAAHAQTQAAHAQTQAAHAEMKAAHAEAKAAHSQPHAEKRGGEGEHRH
jgi:hypothetical protein